MHSIRLISDLHLSDQTPKLNNRFLSCLAEWSHTPISALYILGDWFDYWVGDDDHRVFIHSIEQACLEFSKYKPLYIMHGNRDFLLGNDFSRRCGAKLITEDTYQLHPKVILCHGDHLCTDDHAYQSFRRQSRHPEWKKHILGQSLENRHILAQNIRKESAELSYISDVSSKAIEALWTEYPQAQILIHGHTHRPNRHEHQDGKIRYVIQDWRDDRLGWIDINLDDATSLTSRCVTSYVVRI
jgi:UDP-2,3-diacylglucosamine hydrolase